MVNAGSSSLKLRLLDSDDTVLHTADVPADAEGFDEALIGTLLRARPAPDVSGHRIVHGGTRFDGPVVIEADVRAELQALTALAPLHQPKSLAALDAVSAQLPGVPAVASFDTAFHSTIPAAAATYAVPLEWRESYGIRRYGFHGLSCAFLIDELERIAGRPAAHGRVILAHLGGGSSITAVSEGKSIDTSMGITPAGGLPMASRSGDLDPGLVWYLARTEQLSAKQFNHMVNHESGMLGVSETSGDMRVLLAAQRDDVRAAEAVALFCYHARKTVCAMAGALEGADTLVFSGGIGEHAAEVRARICDGLGFLGIRLDAQRNGAHAAVISADDSAVTVRVIHTDEQRMIVSQVRQVIGQGQS